MADPSAAPGRTRPLASRWQRAFYALSVLALTLSAGYAAIAMLTRVTPALFPGKELQIPVAQQVVEALPGPAKVESPGPDSVFNRPITVLLLGIDQRPDQTDFAALNTDTIMVANIDPVTNTARVLSFPRDLWIQITSADGGIDHGRINTSFAIGASETNSYDGGANQLIRDMRANFGIKIDYWAVIDFRGAEAMVDALGGIDVVIPEDLAIPSWYYSDDDQNGQYISLPPGTQHLDGYTAVAFGRLREPDDDLHRIRRQQLVLQAIAHKAISGGFLENPIGLWSAYSNMVHTNMPSSRVPGLGLLLESAGQNLSTYSIADPIDGMESVSNFTTAGGAEVLAWNPDAVEAWLKVVFPKELANGNDAVAGIGPPAGP